METQRGMFTTKGSDEPPDHMYLWRMTMQAEQAWMSDLVKDESPGQEQTGDYNEMYELWTAIKIL